MDDDQVKVLLGLAARHALTTIGGMLAAGGYLQSSGISDFVGAGMVFAGIGWSWWDKKGRNQVAALLKKTTGKATLAEAITAAKGTG